MSTKLGWIFAGAIVVAVCVAAFMIYWGVPSSPVYTARAGVLERIEPAVGIDTILTLPTGAGNAADHYTRAIAEAEKTFGVNPESGEQIGYAEFVAQYGATIKVLADWPPELKIPEYVLAGSQIKDMELFGKYISPTDAMADQIPQITRLMEAAILTATYGQLLLEADQPEQAETYFAASTICGWHLANDRVRVYQGWATGISIEANGCQHIGKLYVEKDPERYQKIEACWRALQKASKQVERKWAGAFGINQQGRFATGDLLNIAHHDADRAWRVEALLKLGLAKFTAKGRGDRRMVRSTIDEMLASPDPFIKAAATKANAMTRMDVRTAG